MDATNTAIVSAFCEQVVTTEILEAAIERATGVAPEATPDTAAIRRELAGLDDELTRLTAAIAAGGDLEAVTTAIKARETTRRRLRGRLESLENLARLPKLDEQQISAALRKTVGEWRTPFLRNVPQARQVLRKMLVGRLTVTPQKRSDGRYGQVTGISTMAPIIEAALGSKGMASPSIPSWNQVLDWLRAMDSIRKSSGHAA